MAALVSSQVSDEVSAVAFRSAMRSVAASCTIVATGDERRPAGLTATSVCSLTAEPPRMVACINRSTLAHDAVVKNGKLSINILSADQERLARRFAGMVPGITGAERFESEDWRVGRTGVVVLSAALTSFECVVSDVFQAGTHTLFVCDVVALSTRAQADSPLVYFDGNFAQLIISDALSS